VKLPDSTFTLPRRFAGAAVVVLATIPVYRLLTVEVTGLAGEATKDIVSVLTAFAWSGYLGGRRPCGDHSRVETAAGAADRRVS
jgi:hypothetical protein